MAPADSNQQFRELLQVAQQVRSRLLTKDRRLQLRDIYALCFHIACELHSRYADVQIIVGDRVTELGNIQHHWLELPDSGIFVDPAYDDFDSFQPVRIGRTSDQDFSSTYRNGMNSHFDVEDPRDRPEMVYRPRTAYDPERGSE
jgi:hypothetical protein